MVGDNPMSNLRNGSLERKVKREFRQRCKATRAVCWLCRQPIDYSAAPQTPEAFEPDHYHPVESHPHLAYDMTNLRPSHCRCNRARQDTPPEQRRWVQPDW